MPRPLIRRRQLLLGSLLLAACGPQPAADDPPQSHASQPSDGIMRNVAPPTAPRYQAGGGYDANIEARMRALPVRFYMAHWCPVCRRAGIWLEKGGYTVEAFDVDEDKQAANYMLTVNPRGSIPMFEVDGRRVIGFAPDMVRSLLRAAVERRMRGEQVD